MTHYGCIDRGIWARPEVRRLSNEERLLLAYLHTSDPGNMIGVYVLPPKFAAYYTGISEEDVRTALAGPLRTFITFDPVTEEVFVHEAARLQVAKHLKATDNRRSKVERLVEAILSDDLRTAFLTEYADWELASPSGAPSEGGIEAPSKEHRTETETGTETEGGFEGTAKRVFEYWRSKRAEVLNLNGGPKPAFTDKRRSKVRARLREGYSEAQLKVAVDGCLGNDYNVENAHVDLELICRDAAHVDQYRTWAQKKETSPGAQTSPPSMDELDAWLPLSEDES